MNYIKKIILLCLFIVIAFASACQKTPAEPIVISKNQDELLNKINTSDEENGIDIFENIPQKWQESEFGDDVAFTIDADVIIPDVNNIPIYTALSTQFNQSQADIILDYFCEGKELYKQAECLTKSDYETMILELKANINDPNADWRQMTKDNADEYNRALNAKQEELRRLEEMYASAPDKNELQLADTKFHDETFDNQLGVDASMITSSTQEIMGYMFKDNSNIAELRIYNSQLGNGVFYKNLPERSGVYMAKPNNIVQYVYYPDSLADQKVNMDLEDAIALSDSALSAINITDMKLFDVGAGKVSVPDVPYNSLGLCYVLIYTRDIDGIMMTYDCKSMSYDDAYAKSIPYENVIVCVDERGIIQFEWNSPMQIVEKLGSNTQLLDFEKIMDIFKQQIQLQGLVSNDIPSNVYELASKSVNIEKITLTMERIPVQNDMDKYIFVPAWNFYGSEHVVYQKIEKDGNQDNIIKDVMLFAHSYLTINAVDGSIINRKKGY